MDALTVMTGIASHLVPLCLITSTLPRREGFALRAAASLAAFAAYFVLTGIHGISLVAEAVASRWGSLVLYAIFCGMIALMVVMTKACFLCSTLTAIFCAIASYTIQNLGAGLGDVGLIVFLGRPPAPEEGSWLSSLLAFALAVALCYPTFIRPITRHGLTPVQDRRMLAMVVVVVFFDIVYDMAAKEVARMDVAPHLVLILMVAHLGVCALILFLSYEMLFLRNLLVESQLALQMMRERERQYQSSRENIEAINIKCHDIRHQIRRLGEAGPVQHEALDDIAREVNVYDATYDTGNEALDTILTEKALACDHAGIRLTCVAEGTALGSLSPAEIYALFGNMLDNAIEAVSGLDAEDRVISPGVREKFGMVGIHMENRYAGELRFVDGLPQTTKEDVANHGFGMSSMRSLVARHGGTLSARAEDGVFSLNVLMPLHS